MGDHRATIAIKFTLPNKTYETVIGSLGGINYVADSDGVDERVREFFSESWDDYQSWYGDRIAEHYRKENAAQIERDERAQLAALEAKYKSPEPMKLEGK